MILRSIAAAERVISPRSISRCNEPSDAAISIAVSADDATGVISIIVYMKNATRLSTCRAPDWTLKKATRMIANSVAWISPCTSGSMKAWARAARLAAFWSRWLTFVSRPMAKWSATKARIVRIESRARVTSAT